jgi:hypothetical protein
MKKLGFCIIFMICYFTFFSCNLIPQVAVVTIKNSSGEEVRDIIVSYEHASKNQIQTVKIDRLSNNESKTFDLELTSPSAAIGAGVATVFGEIEYYINDIKFDTDNGDGDINLSDGTKSIITIYANGWHVAREK